jgi:hypothetical protein
MKRYILYFFVLLAIVGCKSYTAFIVQRISDPSIKPAGSQFYYSLPQTVIRIKVYASRKISVPGPYAFYADELLGIKGVINREITEWTLDSVRISSNNTVDPEHIYSVQLIDPKYKGFPADFLVQQWHIIHDYPRVLEKQTPFYTHNYQANGSFPNATFKVSYDTLYKSYQRDSIIVRAPVIKSKVVPKDKRDIAQEIANLVLQIRQRRFEMVLADDDPLPEYHAMQQALDEMAQMEQDYLRMFTGFSDKQQYTWEYEVKPNSDVEQQVEMFRFSPKTGISDAGSFTGAPVFMKLSKLGITKNLYSGSLPDVTVSNSLVCRIPDIGQIRVLYQGENLVMVEIPISQMGVVVSVPFSGLNK